MNNKNNFQYIGRSYFFNGKHLFDAPYIIEKHLVLNNIIVLLLKIDDLNPLYSENVFAFNFNGQQLWQIEKVLFTDRFRAYTNIYIIDNKLACYNQVGVEAIVNINNGKIISKELIK
jgi:hypothetical protein